MNELDKEIVELTNQLRDKSIDSVISSAYLAGYFRQAYVHLLENTTDEVKKQEIEQLKYLLKSITT